MRVTQWLSGVGLGVLLCGMAYACGGYGEQSTIQEAMSDEAEVAQPAIAKLREEGPKALARLIAERDLLIDIPRSVNRVIDLLEGIQLVGIG
jgi:hypothetical protein